MNTETLIGICASTFFTVGCVGGAIIIQSVLTCRIEQKISEQIAQAQTRLDNEPDKAKPAWDLARVTLESYFQRNLSQITCIFWLSAAVMAVGFSIVIWGITQALDPHNPADITQAITPANLSIITGLITQFIGGSFLLVYRSVLKQASDYAKALERINSIGMAMQIMDTVPDQAKTDDLKSQTKANIAQLLVQQSYSLASQSTSPKLSSSSTQSVTNSQDAS